MLQKKLELNEKMLTLEKEHVEKSIGSISALKVIVYYKAEHQLNKKLLKMLKEKHKEQK